MKYLKEKDQLNIFTYGLLCGSPKDDTGSMEFPIFSLSKIPSKKQITFNSGNKTTKVSPGYYGRPTLWDHDVLIYAMSKIAYLKNKGLPYGKTIRFHSFEFLSFAKNGDSSTSYKRLHESLQRLGGSLIETNVSNGKITIEEGFSLIEKYKIISESNNIVHEWEITICDWLFNAIENNDMLTINEGYFDLTKTFDRRIYQISRKHCGDQDFHLIGLDKIHIKSGSQSNIRKFKLKLKEIEESNHLPDYDLILVDDIVMISPKGEPKKKVKKKAKPKEHGLDAHTQKEFMLVYPHHDFKACAEQWAYFTMKKGIVLSNPKKAFFAFAKVWTERRPHHSYY